jgi:methionine biosynthesis protein MetW
MNRLIEFEKKRYTKLYKKYVMDDRLKMIHSWIVKNIQKGSKILDIGCGDGTFGYDLLKIGYDVYGVDLSEEIVKGAKSRGIKVKVYNVEDGLPFESNLFDCIFAGEIIEHLIDTDNFITECKRILKKNGFLIITTPNLASLVNRLLLFFGKYPFFIEYRIKKNESGHIRAYTLKPLVSQIIEKKLDVYKILGYEYLEDIKKTGWKMPFHFISLIIGKIRPTLARGIVVISKK